uniref:Uncharacterized protein n=1 Tax=Lepeophtheirus salmonis TaxID=72036 RepID=A0A0K2UP74_LEPSM
MENDKVKKEDDWLTATKGIKFALNNRVEDAQKLLKSDSKSIQLQAGYCYLTFMNAVMTFEEEKMNRCLGTLRSMEKRCNSELSWSPSMASISGMKSRMVRGIWGNGESNVGMHEEEGRLAALRLEQQIILADCQVLAAIINFLQQDWGAYVKGGWVLRKAWKIYQKAYGQIRSLYLKRVGLQGNLLDV